ncbi:MAG: NAD-dependent epimerase/dehydratase family protein [Chloroflexi bacterium]|nr:NAD-dependent epimerase/dehydratase family protein [Chloroflexota bacterium]
MNILIIGGTRFMGPHIVRGLSAVGHHVTVFHRGESQADLPPEVERIHGDRDQLDAYADPLRATQPDVVLDMIIRNRQQAQTLMDLFRGVARRIVLISSADVYRAYNRLRGVSPGPPDPWPLDEEAPLRDKPYPYRDYAQRDDDPMYSYDKIPAEQVVLSDPELSGTVLRLPMVFGPQDRQHRLYSIAKRMADQRPAIILSEEQAAWIAPRGYVEDMAHAIHLAVRDERAAGRVYNVALAEQPTEREWITRIGRVMGWDGRIIALPEAELPEALQSTLNYSQRWSLDSRRLRAELGYTERVDLDSALTRTVEWELAHPPGESYGDAFDYGTEDRIIQAFE